MKFLVIHTRHFIIEAEDQEQAASDFEELFLAHAEDDYEAEGVEDTIEVEDLGRVH